MCGTCGCAQVDFGFGNLMYIFEKIAACCAMSAIISCIIVTIMVSIGLGVGIGYNYSFIDMKTTKVKGESEFRAGDHRPLVKPPTDEPNNDSNNESNGATLRSKSLAISSLTNAPPHDVPPTPPNSENDTNFRKAGARILTLPRAGFSSEKHTDSQPPTPHLNINKKTPKRPATSSNDRRLPYLTRRVWEGEQKELNMVESLAPRPKVKAKFKENGNFHMETKGKPVDAVFHPNERKQSISEANHERKYLNTRRNTEQGKQNYKTKATTGIPTILIPMRAYNNLFPLISKILAQNKNVTLQFVAI